MTNSLKRRTTDKSNADLLALMFEARYPKDNLDHLTNIVLNNNGLKFIANSTFCKASNFHLISNSKLFQVQGLVRLELANNLLSNFFSEENCLDRLESLDLSNNNFTTVILVHHPEKTKFRRRRLFGIISKRSQQWIYLAIHSNATVASSLF